MTRALEALRRLRIAAILGTLSPVLVAQCGIDWQPGPPAAGPNNGVTCMVRLPNGDVVAGGMFGLADSAVARHVARWDGVQWRALGAGVDDFVFCLAALPNGDLLVGGRFQNAGGAPAQNLARWDGTTWSQFAGGCDGEVRALLVLPNGDVVAGGRFTAAGGVPASAIARWDGSTWSPFGTGLNGTSVLPPTVASVARLGAGDLIAGGQFAMLPGVTPNLALARWDGTAWTPLVNASGGEVTGVARTLVVLQNGDVLAGGAMNYSSGNPGQGVLRWDGTSAHPFTSPVLSPFALVIAPNGDVVAGGYSIANTALVGVATWNGTVWTTLPGVPQGVVQAIAHDGSGSLVIGATPAGSSAGPFVHRWNGATWTGLGAPKPPSVNATLRAADGSVYVAGEFTSFGGVAANRIARYRDGVWSPLGAGLDARAKSMTLAPNGDLIVSGDFTTAGGAPANRIARWNGFAWSTIGAGLPMAADRLAAMPNGDVFAAPGSTLWHFDGSVWTQITLPLGGQIRCLAALANGDLLIGGRLGGFFPLPKEHGVWRYQAGTVTPLAGGLLEVDALLEWPAGSNAVIAVGNQGVVSWNGGSWSAIAGTTAGSQLFWCTTMPNGDLLVGGFFTMLGGVAAQNLARFDGTAWHAVQHAGITGALRTVAVADDGVLFTSGSFTQAGPHVAWTFASGTAVCPANVSVVGAGCTGSAGPLALQPDNRPWAGGTFAATASGFTQQAIGLQIVGLQPLSQPLPGGSAGCALFTAPLLIDALLPANGSATATLPLPNDPSLAGLSLRMQVIGLELDATSSIVRITSTNALETTIGAH